MIVQIFLTHVHEKEFYRPCESAVSLVVPCNGPGTAVGAATGPTVKSRLTDTQCPVLLSLQDALVSKCRYPGWTAQRGRATKLPFFPLISYFKWFVPLFLTFLLWGPWNSWRGAGKCMEMEKLIWAVNLLQGTHPLPQAPTFPPLRFRTE